jgi:hypothetical protein
MKRGGFTFSSAMDVEELLVGLQQRPVAVGRETIPVMTLVGGPFGLKDLPDSMELPGQLVGCSPSGDEGFHLLHFVDRTGLESVRIVEDELSITLEDQLVFDVMKSSLCFTERKRRREEWDI